MERKLASFSSRLIAFTVDWFIILLPCIFLQVSLPFFGPFVLCLFYFPLFHASAAQATPGKRLMGLKVISLQGEPISLTASFVRFGVAFLSYFFLCLGHLLALVTPQKQAIHDLVADSLVIESPDPSTNLVDAWVGIFKKMVDRVKKMITKSG